MADLLLMLCVLAFSFLIGYLLISKVPPRLHTPLMSMTNAISAVTILGAVLLFSIQMNVVQEVLGTLAIGMGVFNLVGGFVITNRMLKLFKKGKQSASIDTD